MQKKVTVTTVTILAFVNTLRAAELSGYGGVDLRFFFDTPAFKEQNSSFVGPSVFLQPEFRYEWNNGADRFTATPFGRYDSLDSNRSHWDVREFNWLHQGDNWSVQAGVSKVFWGVAESHHLIDIINQTDFVENINSEDKLGQPMLNFNIPSEYGNFNFMYLPYFRERTFPASNGRIRFVLPVESNNQDMNGLSRWNPDWEVRWSKTFGDWDLGIAHFNGISREPRLIVAFPGGNFINPTGPPTLIPTYDIIHQTSLDLQGAVGNWLLKLEAMTRSGQGDRFGALVGGVEYTHYGVFDTSIDLGLLSEFQYDSRKQRIGDLNPVVPPTAADNDLFLGTRIAFNDTQNSQILMGTIIDVKTQATVFSIEASRRLGDNWKLELESRVFANIPDSDILAGYRRDDYVQLRLTRYLSDLNPSPKIKDTLLASSVQNIQSQQTSIQEAPLNNTKKSTEIDETQVLARLQSWATVWSAGKSDGFISYYHKEFKPDDKTSHIAWKSKQLHEISPNKSISVNLSEIRAEVNSDSGTIITMFKQDYVSNSYIGSTLKKITWRKIDNEWFITEEKILQTLPLSIELLQ